MTPANGKDLIVIKALQSMVITDSVTVIKYHRLPRRYFTQLILPRLYRVRFIVHYRPQTVSQSQTEPAKRSF